MDPLKRFKKEMAKRERILSKAIRQRRKMVEIRRSLLSRNAPASEIKVLNLAILGLGTKCVAAEISLRQARADLEQVEIPMPSESAGWRIFPKDILKNEQKEEMAP